MCTVTIYTYPRNIITRECNWCRELIQRGQPFMKSRMTLDTSDDIGCAHYHPECFGVMNSLTDEQVEQVNADSEAVFRRGCACRAEDACDRCAHGNAAKEQQQ
jgi:hypothetical protein